MDAREPKRDEQPTPPVRLDSRGLPIVDNPDPDERTDEAPPPRRMERRG